MIPASSPLETAARLKPVVSTVIQARLCALHVHWNSRGGNFLDAHELSERAVSGLDEALDLVAERISQLGAVVEVFDQSSSELAQFPTGSRDPLVMMTLLSQVMSAVAETTRNCASSITDAPTVHLLQQIVLVLEKTSWLLDSGSSSAVQSP